MTVVVHPSLEPAPCASFAFGFLPGESGQVFGYKWGITNTLLDTVRVGFPLVFARHYAVDIAEGYRAAHRIHKAQLHLLAESDPSKPQPKQEGKTLA